MKNYSLIVKQFIVLSVFIIIPIISIIFIFNYAIMKYSETEISKSGIGKLDVAKSITDVITQTISNDTIKLSLNEKLNALYGMEDIKSALKSSDNNLMLFQFQSLLEDTVRTNNLYSSVYIYLDNSNYIITNNGVYEKDDFQDKLWIETYNMHKELNEPISWINPRPGDSNGDYYVLSYIFPLTPYTTKLRGSIAINIYESSLSKLINSNNYDSSDYISVINSNGEVISSVDKSQLSKNISDVPYISKILNSAQEKDYFIQKIDGKKYLITYLKTDINNWIYVGVFSLDALTTKVNSLKITIIYVSVGLLILCILLSYIISRRLFNPVKKLVQEIQSRKGIDIIGNSNEVTLLSRTFEAMIRQEDQLFSTLEKDKKNLRENYLLSLLRGKPSLDDEQTVMLPYVNFLCCVLYMDKYKDFATNFSYEQQYYLKTVILNLAEETVGNSFTCSGMVMEGDRIVIVINTDSTDMELISASLKESFQIIQKEAAKVIETTITVCVGNMYDNILKIRNSYIEAQNLLKQRFMLGHEAIIFEKDNHNLSNGYFYPLNIEKQILNNVDTGAKDAVITSLSSFFDELKGNKKLTCDNMMLILNQLLGSTIKYLLERNISVSRIFGSNFNIYSELAGNETLDEAGLFLSRIYLQIIEYGEKLKDDGKSHISKIMEYIQSNYKKDIAINTLADHVGLSYSHVRKIFNDETGENIVNYINNMRIEEAQRLLRQSSMNINDIALSLGYNNKQSFNRFFKKYVGINPGEYRNLKTN